MTTNPLSKTAQGVPEGPGLTRPRDGIVLRVDQLSKTYGKGASAVHAIDDLTFEINSHEFVCIVGPSGAGKTTLLKCLSGLLRPTSGAAYVSGREVVGPPRELALVFQDYARSLLPWLTVRGNVEMPLKGAPNALSRTERQERVSAALDSVGLLRFHKHHPWQLSGGMQQRAAIARALAYQPQLLLMDEPFASVDAQTRNDLEDLMLRLRDEYDMTIVFVTHDIDESVYLSDRVLVLSAAPTTVRREMPIDLARPRDQITTRSDPGFVRYRSEIYEEIKDSLARRA